MMRLARLLLALVLGLVVADSLQGARAGSPPSRRDDSVFDKYGGYKGIKGAATGFFHTERLGDSWWLITPEGHGFFLLSVSMVTYARTGVDETGNGYPHTVERKYAIGQGPKDGFTNWADRWAYYMRDRLKGWGFNTIGTFSYYPAAIEIYRDPPLFPPTGNMPANHMPLIVTKRSGGYALAQGGVKNLYGPIWAQVGGHFPDVFDPKFAAFVEGDARSGAWRDLPWIVFVFPDQTDEMRGTMANHPHLGFIAAATAPAMADDPQALGGAKKYDDATIYTKRALKDFLIAKYGGNLQRLNAAWGTHYTSWDSQGGWGRGTGLLDEDGRNLGDWRSADPQKPRFPALRRDLDEFAAEIIRTWYRTVFEAYRKYKPNHLIATANMDVPHRYVYEGLQSKDGRQVYVDLIYTSDPDAGEWAERLNRPVIGRLGGLTAELDSPLGYRGRVEKVEFDDAKKKIIVTASGVNFYWAGRPQFKTQGPILTRFSSLPPVLHKGGTASPQHYLSRRADWLAPNKFAVSATWYFSGTYEDLKATIKPGDTFWRLTGLDTQEERGEAYAKNVADLLRRRTPRGVRYIVGAGYWALMDTAWLQFFEARNFGLVTIRDNAYDGIEARTARGRDRYGFQARGEDRDYGDFLSRVKAANRSVYEQVSK